MRQKKVRPATFLPPWPPRATRRIGSGSGVTNSKKRAFLRSCGDFVHPPAHSVSAKGSCSYSGNCGITIAWHSNEYIKGQAERHRTELLLDEYRRLLRENGVPYDEPYLA
jgi:hypothetical protein